MRNHGRIELGVRGAAHLGLVVLGLVSGCSALTNPDLRRLNTTGEGTDAGPRLIDAGPNPSDGAAMDAGMPTTNDATLPMVDARVCRPEICDNHIDDDCDGFTDAADPDCRTPDTCADSIPLTTMVVHGNTTGLADNALSTCQTAVGSFPDAFYSLHVTDPVDVSFDTSGSAFDTLLSMRTNCTNPLNMEVACSNDANSSHTSRLDILGLLAGDYTLVVDGDRDMSSGPYTLNATSERARAHTCDRPHDITRGGAVYGHLGMSSHETGSCGGDRGPEDVLSFTLTETTRIIARIADAEGPIVLYMRQDNCADDTTEIVCDNGSRGLRLPELDETLDPGTYYLMIDDLITSTPRYHAVIYFDP